MANTARERKQREYNGLVEKLEKEKSTTDRDYEKEKARKEALIAELTKALNEQANIEKFKIRDNQMYTADIDHAENLKSNLVAHALAGNVKLLSILRVTIYIVNLK